MNIKKSIKFNSQRFIRNKLSGIEDNTLLYKKSKNSKINVNMNEEDSLDWDNYKSIYNHLISYINLMVIDLSRDKKKLCKYLKDIFYSIFKISQEIKNNNKIFENNSDDNDDWKFMTGEQNIYKNNVNLMEQMLKEEAINEKNKLKPLLTQRFENSKSFNVFKSSPFKTKIDRLQKKFKQKEKQYKLDKLNYLFRINEQNNLINKLEKEIQVNNINNMTQRDLNKIKCYPDFSFIKDSYVKKINSINNNHKKLLEDSKDKEIPIINNIEHLSLTNNNKEKKKYNLKDIFSKNIFLLKNGKMNKTRIMRFASFSMSDTKRKVEKIKNYKL